MRCDEREEYREIMRDLGPCDAGLIYPAERHKATIITDDGALADRAWARSVPAVLLKQIRVRGY